MKILIIGADGQVGKELSFYSNEKGHDVIATVRSQLDISKPQNVNEYIENCKPDVVINAAAYTAVDKAEVERDLAYTINYDGVRNIVSACAIHNIPLLHISTDYVFDGAKFEPYTEKDNVSPLGVYGDSKWQGEEAIRKHMSKYVILRVAWVFGAQGNNFVKTMLRLGKERNELDIVSDQFGGPTPARNIAITLINIAEKIQQDENLQWGTYHYCGTPKSSWSEFAKEIFKQAYNLGVIGHKVKVNSILTTQYPTLTKRPSNSMLDCSKLKNILGVDMPDWRKAISEVLINLDPTKNP